MQIQRKKQRQGQRILMSRYKVSRSGKRYVKHVARVGSKDETARPPNVVR